MTLKKALIPALALSSLIAAQTLDVRGSRAARAFIHKPRYGRLPAQAANPITVKSLLGEMTDFENLAREPWPSYKSASASSFDRASLAALRSRLSRPRNIRGGRRGLVQQRGRRPVRPGRDERRPQGACPGRPEGAGDGDPVLVGQPRMGQHGPVLLRRRDAAAVGFTAEGSFHRDDTAFRPRFLLYQRDRRQSLLSPPLSRDRSRSRSRRRTNSLGSITRSATGPTAQGPRPRRLTRPGRANGPKPRHRTAALLAAPRTGACSGRGGMADLQLEVARRADGRRSGDRRPRGRLRMVRPGPGNAERTAAGPIRRGLTTPTGICCWRPTSTAGRASVRRWATSSVRGPASIRTPTSSSRSPRTAR